MNSEFSKILKKKRYEMGISQETLAKKLFVTKAAVSNWEKGNRIPHTDMVIKIAKCLDIDISILMSDGNETPNVIIVDDDMIILKGGIPMRFSDFRGISTHYKLHKNHPLFPADCGFEN